jgi:cell division protease FtsH
MANNDDRERRGRWPGFDLGGGGNSPQPGQRSPWRFSLVYIVGALVVVLLLQSVFFRPGPTATYTTFRQALASNDVKSVRISDTSIEWTTKDGDTVSATLPGSFDSTKLFDELAAHDPPIPAEGVQPNAFTGFLIQALIYVVLLGGLWFFLIRRMAGAGAASALNLGRNRVKIYDRKEMKTTFKDVAGVDEAVEELREVVDFLKNPKKYQRLGGRIPKGVLLLGPPGCGKTLLARAVAGEANVPFFFMSGSEFVEMFVGLGAARVRELFQQAKEKAPCLVFLDELDTIGKSRAGGMGGSLGSHDEREQTLNQLLVEMDGFDSSKGVIIMAATNRGDVLDPALTRPGRFDRQVIVDRPDLKGREAILQVHSRSVALDPTVDLHTLAARTPGFTGADLENVVNEAALLAARREKNSVMESELEEAIDRTVAGLERKSRIMSEKEKVRVATHEMGHALCGLRLKNIDPVHRVTIIPRGAGALGITMTRPLEDRYLLTEPELLDRLVFALGGRVAEEIVFQEISTGAADDLQKATEIARAMITEYGMSKRLGPLAYGSTGFRRAGGMGYLFPGDRPEYSEDTAQVIDEEAGRMLAEAHDRATQILNQDQQLLQNLSRVLMAREVIEGAELKRLVDGEIPIPSDEELDRETEERAKQAAEETARIERERARSAETGPSIISSDGAEGVAVDGDGRRPARVPGAADTEDIPPRPD